MKHYGIVCCLAVLFFACMNESKNTGNLSARGVFTLSEADSVFMPVSMRIDLGEQTKVWFINGEEQIEAETVTITGDSVHIEMPVFETGFRLKMDGETWTGNYYELSRKGNYTIPFSVSLNDSSRFKAAKPREMKELSWELYFGEEELTPGHALFQNTEKGVLGTILTETGDYRYLQGALDGKRLQLSTFDGSHVFLFDMEISGKQLKGTFYSGNHWKQTFYGSVNEDIELAHPDSLTWLNEGYDGVSFSFPDTAGNMLNFPNADYLGKPVVIQLLGSWCPNCMDETRFLLEMRKEFPDLQVIGLAFERSGEFERDVVSIKKMVRSLNIDYPVLHAGSSSKTAAAEALPMLNHVLSFPTAIFIDREGKVQKIHTGFYGPGTGDLHLSHKKELTDFIQKLNE